MMKALSINAINRYRSIQELREALIVDEAHISAVSNTVRIAHETQIKELRKAEEPQIAVRHIVCKKHPESGAKWKCINCDSAFCERCVDIQYVSPLHSPAICRTCRDMCVDLSPEVSDPLMLVKPKQKRKILVASIVVASILTLYLIISNLTILKEYKMKNAVQEIAGEVNLAVKAYKEGTPFLIKDHTGSTECVSTRPTTGGFQSRQKCNGVPALYQCADLQCIVNILVSVKKSTGSPFDKSQPLYNYTAGSARKIGAVVLKVEDNHTVHIYAYGKTTKVPISYVSVSSQ